MKFVVQRWEPTTPPPHGFGVHGVWHDISVNDPFAVAWDAADAGHAFQLAVLGNPDHRLQSTSYRVLPYEGGVTFNVGVNLDATAHTDTTDTTAERKGA